jgi:hypothetical protein
VRLQSEEITRREVVLFVEVACRYAFEDVLYIKLPFINTYGMIVHPLKLQSLIYKKKLSLPSIALVRCQRTTLHFLHEAAHLSSAPPLDLRARDWRATAWCLPVVLWSDILGGSCDMGWCWTCDCGGGGWNCDGGGGWYCGCCWWGRKDKVSTSERPVSMTAWFFACTAESGFAKRLSTV